MNNKIDEPDEAPEKQVNRRTYATDTTVVQLSSQERPVAEGSRTAEKMTSPRKTKGRAKGAERAGELSDLLSMLGSQTDLFVPTNVRLHPMFRALLKEDTAKSKRSMNLQLMVGYLTYRSLSPAALRKRAALLGRLGAWINDHDVPEADKQVFAEILLETQAAFRGQ